MLPAEGATASAVSVLANLPRQPPPSALGLGLLHGADARLQDSVRLLFHRARSPPRRACQRHGPPDRALGVAPAAGSDAVGAAAPLSDPGPRPLVWRRLHQQSARDRDRDGPHAYPRAEGERHRRACYRNVQARVSRPPDPRERAASAVAAERVRRALQPRATAPVAPAVGSRQPAATIPARGRGTASVVGRSSVGCTTSTSVSRRDARADDVFW